MPQSNLNLKALSLESLHSISGVLELDAQFLLYLQEVHPSLHEQLLDYRSSSEPSSKASPYFLMDVAKHIEDFLAQVFDIYTPLAELNGVAEQEACVATFKKNYVLREAKREMKRQDAIDTFEVLDEWLDRQLPDYADRELATARWAMALLDNKTANEATIHRMIDWCISAMTTDLGQAATGGWVSFQIPKIFTNLIIKCSIN